MVHSLQEMKGKDTGLHPNSDLVQWWRRNFLSYPTDSWRCVHPAGNQICLEHHHSWATLTPECPSDSGLAAQEERQYRNTRLPLPTKPKSIPLLLLHMASRHSPNNHTASHDGHHRSSKSEARFEFLDRNTQFILRRSPYCCELNLSSKPVNLAE